MSEKMRDELTKSMNQMLLAIRKHLPHEWEKLKKEIPNPPSGAYQNWDAWEWAMDNPIKN